MTWTIHISGHDNLDGDEKIAYENAVIEKARALAEELKAAEGGQVSTAQVTTNTGTVNL